MPVFALRSWPMFMVVAIVASFLLWGGDPGMASAQPADLEFSSSNITVAEGGTSSYRLRLGSAPASGDVVFVVPAPPDASVVSVAPSYLEFTSGNWDAYQTVYVSTRTDDVDRTNPDVSVAHKRSVYSGGPSGPEAPTEVSGAVVTVTVTDDDTRGVALSRTSLTVAEGDDAFYSVNLRSEPTGDVTVTLGGSVAALVEISTDALTFTPANWSVPQTVVVRGVRDDVADGLSRSATVTHTVVGGDYDGYTVSDVSVSVTDDDVKGLELSLERLAITEGGSGSATIRLTSKPTDVVTVTLSSGSGVELPEMTLTFPVGDWGEPKRFVVSNEDNDVAHGVRAATVALSASGGGYGSQRASLAVSLLDNDPVPNSRLWVSKTHLTVGEGAATAYYVRLAERPVSNVSVALSSRDAGIAAVSPTSLTFTPSNWRVDREVTVTGAEDFSRVLGGRATHVAHAVEGANQYYVSVAVSDDDVAGLGDAGVLFTHGVAGEELESDAVLTVAEGSTGSYQVSLQRRPSGNVRLFVVSSAPSAVVVSPLFLDFTPSDYSVPQPIAVRSLDDRVASGDATRAVLLHRLSGGGYDQASVRSLNVVVTDDDAIGVTVNPTALALVEGASGGYSVVLNSEPLGPVSFYVSSIAGSGVTGHITRDEDMFLGLLTGPSQLTFTPSNWDEPKTIRVQARADSRVNGTRGVDFSHEVHGGGYDAVSVDSFNLLTLDDDFDGVTVSESSLSLAVGDQASFTIHLNSDPGVSGKTVHLAVDSESSSVLTLSDDALDFTDADWHIPKRVVVTGVGAGRATVSLSDGDALGSVFVTVRSSASAGVTINPAGPLHLGLNGVGSYTVVLDERPSSNVVVSARSSVPAVGTVSPSDRTFTPTDWDVPQSFTVLGVGDGEAVISHVANGANFSNSAVGSLSVVVATGTSVVEVSTSDLRIGVGGQGSYTLTLVSGGQATVTVVSSDVSNAVVSHSSVVLTGTTPQQTVTVTGVGAGSAVISHGVSVGGTATSVNVTIASNSVLPGFTLSNVPGTAGAYWEWAGEIFTVELGTASGLKPGKVWVYRVPVGDNGVAPLSCHTGRVSALHVAEGDFLAGSGATISEVRASSSLFEYAVNFLCVIDEEGKGQDNAPLRLTIHEPPETYRVWLKNASIGEGGSTTLAGAALPDDFRVFHGRQGVGGASDAWSMPQFRGTGDATGDALTETSGTLYHCKDVEVVSKQVGCEWEEHRALSAEPWRVGIEPADVSGDTAIKVPGDVLEFRVDFNALDARLKDRFFIYWGPVDLWRLDADGVGDFAVHEEHVIGLTRTEVFRSDLTSDGFYQFRIPRYGSTNELGKTFVSLVRCNDDFITATDSEVARNEAAFSDCTKVDVPFVNFDAEHRELELLRRAWSQHDVMSGRGLTCGTVKVTVTRLDNDPDPDVEEWVEVSRAFEVDCSNEGDATVFTTANVGACHDDLVAAGRLSLGDFTFSADSDLTADLFYPGGLTSDPVAPLYCGFGPVEPFYDIDTWGSTRYNAARSFYGFVIDWQRGFGVPPNFRDGCMMVLPYRTVRLSDGSLAYYGEAGLGADRPYGTERWLLGDAGELDLSDGVDEAELCFLAPNADPAWSFDDYSWHDAQAMHFAVYVSGMPAEHDHRVGDADDGWRRTALGAWDWRDEGGVPGGGVRRRIGFALPTDVADGRPVLSEFHLPDGYSFSVSRDYADAQGRVYIYLVPCLPWQGDHTATCDDLAEGTGSGQTVIFKPADEQDGPFGVDPSRSGSDPYTLVYSQKFTVNFGNVAVGLPDDRPVSLPALSQESITGCTVVRGAGGVWPERLVQGGGCTAGVDDPVTVVVENSEVTHGLQNFIVYATGGRSDGLDLVNMRRSVGADASPAQLARLGLLERVVSVPAGDTGEARVVVTPDMAGDEGDVYLLFYECGGVSAPICARNSRGSAGLVPDYDVPVDPAFVVRVDWLDSAGLVESNLRPVCQGRNCEPLMPFLRAEAPADSVGCEVRGYDGGADVDDLTYWPDRVVSGGACTHGGFLQRTVSIPNSTSSPRRLVVYSTGGRGYGLDLAQVRRHRAGTPGWSPAGKVGLKRDVLSLAAGASGSVTVDYGMVDSGGNVLLLAYDCPAGVCPDAVNPGNPTVFSVDRRPLFQVVVNLSPPRAVTVTPDSLQIAEGAEGVYEIVLGSRPTGDVYVAATAAPDGRVSVAPSPLLFNSSNWSKPQRVTVTSLSDDDVFDDQVHITHSITGADYSDVDLCPNGCPVSVSIIDDDSVGVDISETDISVREDSSASYSVSLRARPSALVEVTPVVSSADGVVTVSPASLSFTPLNWQVPQEFTLEGVVDRVSHDPLRTATVTHDFAGGGYDGVQSGSVAVTVLDVTVPGSAPRVVVSEHAMSLKTGSSGTYSVSLSAEPSSAVTVSVSSRNSSVATVSPSALTFTTANWMVAQVVTVNGEASGEAVVEHQVSGGGYDFVRVSSVVVTVAGADPVKGVVFSGQSVRVLPGGSASYTARLTAAPSGDVTLSLSSDAPGVAVAAPGALVFTTGNWHQVQTVTVHGISVGATTISHAISGGGYGSVSVPVMDVSVVSTDGPGGGLGGVNSSADGGNGGSLSDDGGAGFDLFWKPQTWLGAPGPPPAVDVAWLKVAEPTWLFRPEPLPRPAVFTYGGRWSAVADFAPQQLLDRGWQWFGDYFDLTLYGFTPNARIWAYRLVVDDGDPAPTDCRTEGRSALPIKSAITDGSGGHLFSDLLVSAGLFAEGKNYVCAVDAMGLILPSPKVLTVYDPPDVYRMQLSIIDVSTGGMSQLSDEFKVIDGQHYDGAHESPWSMPQFRGVSRDNYLTRTNGVWHRCSHSPEAHVGRDGVGTSLKQVGCDWDEHDSSVPGKVGIVRVPSTGSPAVKVPGDDVEFRIGFHPTQFSGREKERFAVFWGPVDMWLLGAPDGVQPSDFTIHKAHLAGLNWVLVTQSDLDPDGNYLLKINRESANSAGDTFVSVVPCNEDYLGPSEPGSDLERNRRALPGCGLPLTPSIDFDVSAGDGDDVDGDPLAALRQAWRQHDVTSGLGMSCDVTVVVTRTVEREDANGNPVSYSYERTYDIQCENNLKTGDQVAFETCDVKLREVARLVPTGTSWSDDRSTATYSNLICGWGPPRPFLDPDDISYWGSARYNAARSIYGFVIDWYRGGGGADGDDRGCRIDVLRYRVNADDEYVSVMQNQRPVGTKYWRLGTAPENDVDCTAAAGEDAVDVNIFMAAADPTWDAVDRDWHGAQAAHFALYVSGLNDGHVVDAEDTDPWRRVALGSWDWSDARLGLDGGLQRPLGMVLPNATDGAEADSPSGLSLPSVRAFYEGRAFAVTRDMADANGVVRLYVVPCLPNYAYVQPHLRVCRDLSAGAGHGFPLEFRQATSDAGPFGLLTTSTGQVLRYSYVVTVNFEDTADSDLPVSIPGPVVLPSGQHCEVVRHRDGHWEEVRVAGGACDVDSLQPVQVHFRNDGSDLVNLAVYGTGGRSHELDLVEVKHTERNDGSSASSAERLGRLGVLERAPLPVPVGGRGTVTVTPGMADAEGDVWLLAYRCGGGVVPLCPRSGRGKSGEITGFRMAPAVSFAVRVRFTEASGIKHTELGPICQGDDCDPPVPDVLLEARPDLDDGTCGVATYDNGRLWPDRLVRDGACAPHGLGPLQVSISQPSAVKRDVVVFATGGRDTLLRSAQVNRGPGSGTPAGALGLRRVQLSDTGHVLVDPDLADANGQVLLLGYLCSDSSDAERPTSADRCPSGIGDVASFDVSRRPLFQVLVEYDAELLRPSGFAICRGDSCSEVYELERFEEPSGPGCSVSASYSGGSLYWPDRVVAGGACDRHELDDVSVTFSIPSSSSEERLVVYVTGGRSPGLQEVDVLTAEPGFVGGAVGRFDVSIPFPEDVDADSPGVRANVSAVAGVLDGKDWVQDGLVGVEKLIHDGMRDLAVFDAATAELVAAMSFLDSVDETDRLTVRALVLAAERDVADDIVGHSVFSGDIGDNDRLLVIGASLYSDEKASDGGVVAVSGRLDDGHYQVGGDDFSTVHTPSLRIRVAHNGLPDQDVSDAVALVGDSVEAMEVMMGRPFPISHVVMFLDPGMFARRSPGTLGLNYGGVVFAVRPGIDRFASTVIHEVAHYYWYGARIWIDEGMAETAVAAFGASLGVQGELERREEDCPRFDNLSELDPVADRLPEVDQLCPYYLGQQLFLDLRESLGVPDFRAGVRLLYDTMLAKKSAGVRWGYWATVDDLRKAFSGNEVAQQVIDHHWYPAISGSVVTESLFLGRMGLRQETLTIPADGAAMVSVSPDLAWVDGHVWLLAYRCDSSHGDSGCPMLRTPVSNGYDLSKGPDFAVRVKFTEEAGLESADLRRVCIGTYCDFRDPWLRQAEPSADDCSVQLSSHWDFWPDRVIRGGGCNFYGTRFGSVDFGAEDQEKFVVYSTGGNGHELEMVPVYGVLDDADVSADGSPEQLGADGLNEHRMSVEAGGSGQVWLRSEMADDDGNVWLFVYRCDDSFGDDGCPLVGRDAVRPSYDIDIRPAFVVRVGFVAGAVSGTLDADCSAVSNCRLTAVFRDAGGNTLPGTAEFRVDRGGLGAAGSTALSSRQPHTVGTEGGYIFVETLQLPTGGGIVNVEAELLVDGTTVNRVVGVSPSVERISSRVVRCSGDEGTCHDGSLEATTTLSRGDWFVIEVTGYDAAGDVGFSWDRQTRAVCEAGPLSPWPTISLSTSGLRSYNYDTSQRADRGYAGCAYQVTDDAAYGSHGYTVSFNSGGSVRSDSGTVTVGRSAGDLAYLGITGPSSIESGETGDFQVFGYNSAGLPVSVADGCVDVTVSGAVSGAAECLVEGISVNGEEFTVTADDDVVLNTDSSVGVTLGDLSVRKHVLVVPASEDPAPAPVVGDSHISSLAIEQQDTQLRMSWVGSPTAAFASMRAQVWVQIGGEDEFLPGCMGGEPHDVSAHEVFCLLSYGQSGDVYHGAVGYIRYDGSAVPIETVQWVRP